MGEEKLSAELDTKVDYKEEYLPLLVDPHISGDEVSAICPFHDDDNPSFSLNLLSGQYYCHGCGHNGNIITFLSELPGKLGNPRYNASSFTTRTKQEVLDYLKEKYSLKIKEKKPKKLKHFLPTTVESYADEKCIPERYLRDVFFLSDSDLFRPVALAMPYRYANGGHFRTKYRREYTEADDTEIKHTFLYSKEEGSNSVIPYGLWMLNGIDSSRPLILVEGESDTQAMYYLYGRTYAVLGIPGANSFLGDAVMKSLTYKEIYIHVERDRNGSPDSGGSHFLTDIPDKLWEAGYKGTIKQFSVRLVDSECKDPSDVLIKNEGHLENSLKVINAAIKEAKEVTPRPTSVNEMPDGCPVALKCPPGFYIDNSGIYTISAKAERTKISHTPIVITRKTTDIETGKASVELAWKRGGAWRKHIFERSVISSPQSIVQLADLDMDITSVNAKKVIAFLADLEGLNTNNDDSRRSRINSVLSTACCGWKSLGGEWTPDDDFVPYFMDNCAKDTAKAASGGEYWSAMTEHGDYQLWRNTIKDLCLANNVFHFLIAASLSSPLLKINKVRNFTVYQWASSKAGKTAALKAAISCWGDPNRLITTFNATQTSLNALEPFFNDCILALDEKDQSRDVSADRIIYDIGNGQGRLRANVKGEIKTTQKFRIIGFATGEEPLTSDSANSGTDSRMLTLEGSPFNGDSKDSIEQKASFLHAFTADNYGFAAPKMIKVYKSFDRETLNNEYQILMEMIKEATAEGHKDGDYNYIIYLANVALSNMLMQLFIFDTEDVPADPYRFFYEEHGDEVQARRRATVDFIGKFLVAFRNEAREEDNIRAIKFLLEQTVSSEFGEIKANASSSCIVPVMTRMVAGATDDDEIWLVRSAITKRFRDSGYSWQKTMKFIESINALISASRIVRVTFSNTGDSINPGSEGTRCRMIILNRHILEQTVYPDEKPQDAHDEDEDLPF